MEVALAWARRLGERKVWYVSGAFAYLGAPRFAGLAASALEEAAAKGRSPGGLFVEKLKGVACGNSSLYEVLRETSGDRRRDNERKTRVKKHRFSRRNAL